MTNRILAIGAVLILIASTGWANEDGHGRTVAEVELEIRETLGLTEDEAIDPEVVPEELLIELGDAVMGFHVGDPESHEWMDKMMGGEGSESLDAAHQWMAYRYLAGGYGDSSDFGMMGDDFRGGGMMGNAYRGGGMMGGGMMGGGMMGGWGLMGNPDMMFGDIPYDSPERVLEYRYSRGDITRREYRRMLRDLE